MPPRPPLTPELLDKLNQSLIDRSIAEGFALLRRSGKDLARLNPSSPQAVGFLLCIAQWVDLGYRDFAFLEDLAERFAKISRAEMPFGDYVRLRMVEALRAFVAEDAAKSAAIFGFILQVEPGIMEPHLLVIAHYWKCRAHRRQGEYELALHHIQSAKAIAQEMGAPRLVAVTNIHESWLLFQRGQRREALRLLDDAEAELKSTGHALSPGNIESARGRFVRRSGEYARALEHFHQAIAVYSKHFPNHPNLARALVNAAYVKRLIALDLAHKAKQ